MAINVSKIMNMISVISPLILLTQDLFQQTKDFYSDLRKGMIENDEMIVVDNGSIIKVKPLLEKNDIYIRTPKALGYGLAANLGLKIAQGNYLFVVNNDMRISSEWRDKILENFKENEKIGIVSCHAPWMIPSVGIPFNGIFFAIKREVINDIGYFYPLYPRQGHDSDFCLRAVAAGWEINTVEIDFSHPERKSSHIQPNYDQYLNKECFKNPTFHDRWGVSEKDWYREALKRRNI